MGQIERLLATLSVFLVFIYVVLRAVYVPTFHDEAATFFHYIVSENFLPFQAHWDANNHFLNSALGWICYKLLGPDQLSIRLPNVLSFLVYGYFCVRISEDVKHQLIRWSLLIALLASTFLIEFFAFARGYAMSIAFLLGAIYHGSVYLKSFKLGNLLYLWFWMILAIAASLTLINSYLIFLGVVAIGFLRIQKSRWKHVTIFLVFGMPFLIAAVLYAFGLKERGLLYTGFDDGFVEVTVASLVRHQLGSESDFVSYLVTFIGGISSVFVIIRFLTKSIRWNAVRLAAILLFLNACGSILLNLLFGMNFPENRVGMYYIPLFLITLAGALDEWSVTTKKVKWLALGFFVIPAHLVKHFNLDSSILWPPWHGSQEIYQKAIEHQRKAGEVLTVSADYLNELGWAYYNFQNNAELQLLQRDPVPDTLADLIVARPTDFGFSDVPYETILHDEANDIFLLNRKSKIDWSLAVELMPSRREFSGSNEFYELLNDSLASLPGSIGILELKGVFTSDKGLFDGQLVITSTAPDGGTYNMVPLHWIRPTWNEDTLYIKRTYHFSEDATNVKIYFWNLHRDSISFRLDELTFRSPK